MRHRLFTALSASASVATLPAPYPAGSAPRPVKRPVKDAAEAPRTQKGGDPVVEEGTALLPRRRDGRPLLRSVVASSGLVDVRDEEERLAAPNGVPPAVTRAVTALGSPAAATTATTSAAAIGAA